MNMTQKLKIIFALLLVFMIVISPALAAEEPKDKITIIKGDDVEKADDQSNDKKSSSDSDDAMDKIVSDDTILGFDKNKDYDISQDVSVQSAIDTASSLPPWKLFIVIIMLLCVLVGAMYVTVVLWNLFKGGKAATNENPAKAAQGIKDSKMINRSYTEEIIEGALFIGGLIFLVGLLSS